MPTYSYRCQSCDHTFDLFQRMSEDPARICPECGKAELKRLIGAGAGFIFKGSGFYVTDYRSKDYKEKAKKEASENTAKSDTAKSDTAKSDTAKSDTAKSGTNNEKKSA